MTSPSQWTAALDVLRHASQVTIHTVGFAAQRLPEMIAYEDVRRAGAAAREDLQQLLREGSPSGRVYAALLLEAIDAEEGRAAWMSLRNDGDFTAVHCGGCMPHYPTTVGAFASAVLDAGGAESAMAVGGVPPWSISPD
ncbi:hypothetical protein LZC95_44495 [Pendulispora brunnea]|uniref:Uncharacterized protein n=1 Tax=Pendulispora brunnea TaxID=2905690 RepID=A0ABZ2K8R8_9BACT